MLNMKMINFSEDYIRFEVVNVMGGRAGLPPGIFVEREINLKVEIRLL